MFQRVWKYLQAFFTKGTSPGVEELILTCLKELAHANREKDEELWAACHHPETLAMLGRVEDGVMLGYYLQRQVHENGFPKAPFHVLREVKPKEAANLLFSGNPPTHVAQFETFALDQITRPSEQRTALLVNYYFSLTQEGCRIVLPIPSNAQVEEARAYLARVEEERRSVEELLPSLSPAMRDQIMAYKAEDLLVAAVRYVKEQTQLPLATCRALVTYLWAARQPAEHGSSTAPA